MQKGRTLFPCETRCRQAALRFRGTQQHGAPLAQGLGPSLSYLRLNFFLQDDPGNHNSRQGPSQSPQASGVGGIAAGIWGTLGLRSTHPELSLVLAPLTQGSRKDRPPHSTRHKREAGGFFSTEPPVKPPTESSPSDKKGRLSDSGHDTDEAQSHYAERKTPGENNESTVCDFTDTEF